MEEGSLDDGNGGLETCSGGAWQWGWVGRKDGENSPLSGGKGRIGWSELSFVALVREVVLEQCYCRDGWVVTAELWRKCVLRVRHVRSDPIQSPNPPNGQIWPVQLMTWTAGSNPYIKSIAGHIFGNLTQSSWVQVRPKPNPWTALLKGDKMKL